MTEHDVFATIAKGLMIGVGAPLFYIGVKKLALQIELLIRKLTGKQPPKPAAVDGQQTRVGR